LGKATESFPANKSAQSDEGQFLALPGISFTEPNNSPRDRTVTRTTIGEPPTTLMGVGAEEKSPLPAQPCGKWGYNYG
jgi:hypothetical protein